MEFTLESRDLHAARKALAPLERFIERLKATRNKLTAELAKARKSLTDKRIQAAQLQFRLSSARNLFDTGLLQDGDSGALDVLEALLSSPHDVYTCEDCDCPRLVGIDCPNCEANRLV